ncbi:hypothetical protein CEXT_217381 [Caerostris extrusa]|uniref:Uncharacterized protein n=1 Tax=Caerostris extrusa TaxID=172846 RepID=A0AAV4SJQ8_CAEEX|nr:hypothetical protein CEXT_217381 [Caerostris extrusa]
MCGNGFYIVWVSGIFIWDFASLCNLCVRLLSPFCSLFCISIKNPIGYPSSLGLLGTGDLILFFVKLYIFHEHHTKRKALQCSALQMGFQKEIQLTIVGGLGKFLCAEMDFTSSGFLAFSSGTFASP